VRIGGFGGVEGLSAYLAAERITAVVDATHPFAATMSANAAEATDDAGVPRLVLRRPGWTMEAGWTLVDDMRGAAAAVLDWDGTSVFLTTGRGDLDLFAPDDRHDFLARTVDPPEGEVPARMTLVLDRGPYTVAGERALMTEHRIGLLVTKNSGGAYTVAKLEAARELGLAVVMVQRPALPQGSATVGDAEEAATWVAGLQPG
jgi:precorrin-6A/cobalt-precorrin-6A reductase